MPLGRYCVTIGLAAGALAASAGPTRAQAQQAAAMMPESYRQVQLSALDLQRRMLLVMADSMPERLYRDKVTPIQRDFAQQLQHAAGAMTYIIPMTMGVPAAAGLPDTAAALNSRAGMRGYVNAVYDWAGNLLRSQSADDRATMTRLFRSEMPRWQVWDELHMHTIWTCGQVVANFRKHGMAPPGFGFF